MEIRHEDLDPSLVWGLSIASIAADCAGMRDVAAALQAELIGEYVPYRDRVDAHMMVPVASPAAGFVELVEFLTKHNESQQITTALLAEHGNATGAFASAADLASQRYADSDESAAARAGSIALPASLPASSLPASDGA